MDMILSLDPGSSKIGWSIVDFDGHIVDQGLLNPVNNSNINIPFNKKMNILIKHLVKDFTEILDKGVTHVAWEIVPSFGRMAQRELVQATATTLKVLCFQRDLPYQQFTPGRWHKSFVGKSSCTKEEVKSLILSHNIIREEDNQIAVDYPYDVYDAMAIGITAAKLNEWITDELL